MRVLLLIFVLFLIGEVSGQNAPNRVDEKGKKQGFWIKKDREGTLIYQATFKDDKPIGEMKRFHPNGKVMAILNFAGNSDESDAQLFDERGNLIAKGKYMGQKKVGEWTYLVDSKVVLTETYNLGLKDGKSRRFYKTGELLEESDWKNDKLHGLYKSYFQDGKVYMECNYSDGLLNGRFVSFFVNGNPELEAVYSGGVRDRDWNYYNNEGKLRYTLKFNAGKLLNPEVQDSVEQARSLEYRTREDNIPDPEKFMQNPEEYMQLMQNRDYIK